MYTSLPVCSFVCSLVWTKCYCGRYVTYMISVYSSNFIFDVTSFESHTFTIWCDWFCFEYMWQCTVHFTLSFLFSIQTNSFGLETNSQVQTNKEEVCVFFWFSKSEKNYSVFFVLHKKCIFVWVDFERNRKVYFCFTTSMTTTLCLPVHTFWSVMGIIK